MARFSLVSAWSACCLLLPSRLLPPAPAQHVSMILRAPQKNLIDHRVTVALSAAPIA